jgi:hypothetical protein
MKIEPISNRVNAFAKENSICACQVNYDNWRWGVYPIFYKFNLEGYHPKPIVYWRVKKLKHDTPTN